MKVCVIQPEYSTDHSRSEEYFQRQLALLAQCDESMDIIVLPESADTPCKAHDQAQRLQSHQQFNRRMLEQAQAAARRCNAIVFFNARFEVGGMLRNTTYALDRQGNLAGQFFKQHLTPGEFASAELDHSYTLEHEEPTILELEGVRYAFLVCYDSYFYESFAQLGRYDPDVIIVCSHQRTDSRDALRTMNKFLAYNTNAWVLRSSVSMGADSPVGGGTMIVAPDGAVLADMESRVGLACAEIDPHRRHLKPAGFGGALECHHHYVEVGRRPWKYRNGGAAMALFDEWMPYPRVCAHRGFNTVAPENSLPAYGAAIALGAQEIEFDLWPSKDGVVVSTHDKVLDRVSNGTGLVWEYTYEELLQFDFGVKKNENFSGMRICTFEDILKRFAGQAVMNIHIKDAKLCPVTEGFIAQVARLIQKYDAERWCYFMSGTPYVLDLLRRVAPQIKRCAGAGSVKPYDLVAKALEYGCEKIQIYSPDLPLFGPAYVAETCRRAHEKGIRVNICQADTPEEVERYLAAGCDTVLTNDFWTVSQAVAAWKANH